MKLDQAACKQESHQAAPFLVPQKSFIRISVAAFSLVLGLIYGPSQTLAQAIDSKAPNGLERLVFSSNESLPLPPGEWRLVWKDDYDFCPPNDTRCTNKQGRVMALLNESPESPLRAMIVRQSLRVIPGWSAKKCYERNGVELLDFHGTQENWNLNKCSYGLPLKKGLETSTNWYWTRVRAGLEALNSRTPEAHYNYGMFILLQSDGKRFEVNVLIDRSYKENRLNDTQMQAWKSLYVDAVSAGLFSNKLLADRSVLALNYLGVTPSLTLETAASRLKPLSQSDTANQAAQPTTSKPSQQSLTSTRDQVANGGIKEEKRADNLALQRQPSDIKPPATVAQKEQANQDTARVASLEAELARMREVLKALQEANTPEQATSAKPAGIKQLPKNAPRYGLVIGNADYKNVPKLDNSNKDAQAFAVALKDLGFKTTLHLDVSQRSFNRAVREFKEKLHGGEEVVFYFAGHGVQLGSTNYLLPTDVGGDSADQVKDEAVELQRVLDSLSEKEMKFSLAVVDACRDNPFKGSGRAIGGRGLAPTSAATGQMIIFSAGAGQQALDRLGPADKEPNGLFTRIFLREMQKPGVPVDSMLRQVRKEVVRLAKSVGHEQVPALYDQTVGEFYFNLQ